MVHVAHLITIFNCRAEATSTAAASATTSAISVLGFSKKVVLILLIRNFALTLFRNCHGAIFRRASPPSLSWARPARSGVFVARNSEIISGTLRAADLIGDVQG